MNRSPPTPKELDDSVVADAVSERKSDGFTPIDGISKMRARLADLYRNIMPNSRSTIFGHAPKAARTVPRTSKPSATTATYSKQYERGRDNRGRVADQKPNDSVHSDSAGLARSGMIRPSLHTVGSVPIPGGVAGAICVARRRRGRGKSTKSRTPPNPSIDGNGGCYC